MTMLSNHSLKSSVLRVRTSSFVKLTIMNTSASHYAFLDASRGTAKTFSHQCYAVKRVIAVGTSSVDVKPINGGRTAYFDLNNPVTCGAENA